MKSKNTLSLRWYMAKLIILNVTVLLCYKNLLFRCIGDLSFNTSFLILCGMFLCSMVAGFFITFEHYKNNISLFVICSLPCEIYSAIICFNDYTVSFSVIFAVAVALVGLNVFRIMGKKIKNLPYKREIIKRRLNRVFADSGVIASFSLIAILVPMLFNAIGGFGLYQPKVKPVSGTKSEYTISKNIEDIIKFEESYWSKLKISEKLDLLQILANIEANELGITCELNVTTKYLEDKNGYYSDKEHRIVIDTEHLKESGGGSVMTTICHEAYHSYQFRLVEMYKNLDENEKKMKVFEDAAVYEYEFSNYISSEDDFYGYYNQLCEIRAREYGTSAFYKYYEAIQNAFETEVEKDEN